MGKHTKRKAPYLPKVAAGAAPLALLFAAPATTALVAPAEAATLPLDLLPFPLDHQHDGSVTRDLKSNSDAGTSASHGSVDVVRHDVYRKQIGAASIVSDVRHAAGSSHEDRDTTVADPRGAPGTSRTTDDSQGFRQAQAHTARLGGLVTSTGNDQWLRKTETRAGDLSLDPAAGVARTHEADRRLLGAGESSRHGVWLPEKTDLLTENAEQLDSGLARSATLDAGPAGEGRFAGDLGGSLDGARSSGQAVDFGDVAAFGTTSAQHGHGQFSGTLTAAKSGTLSQRLAGITDGTYEQTHVFGGNAGPVSGNVSATQTANLANRASTDETPPRVDSGLADSISGDLGVEHVVRVQGGTTTSVRGVLPDQPHATRTQSLNVGVADQPPVDLSPPALTL
ncbi:hypothetical protein [Amycolatopsis sp. NPDC059021]|uniref:hypothetical protein n=1 Tax=Amycolatopsis sp. NPDC059021 TaxID=3346704 RepID=UPI00367191A7